MHGEQEAQASAASQTPTQMDTVTHQPTARPIYNYFGEARVRGGKKPCSATPGKSKYQCSNLG